jgi:type III pantothenate kinase
MSVLCIDVGNSHTRVAVVSEQGEIVRKEKIKTAGISQPEGEIAVILDRFIASGEVEGVSYCSVVPGIYPHLLKHLRVFTTHLFNLSHKTCVGLRINYPNPAEIGQDRLANTIGAQAKYGTPAIVIDMGTAVTLDVLSKEGGYEGGVIAPGLAVMSHYLHEKTALLPEVDPSDWQSVSLIGKSTREAIGIGCRRGFEGMIVSLVKPIYDDLERRDGVAPKLISAGGDARFLENHYFDDLIYDEDITLYGLYEAFRRDATQKGH